MAVQKSGVLLLLSLVDTHASINELKSVMIKRDALDLQTVFRLLALACVNGQNLSYRDVCS